MIKPVIIFIFPFEMGSSCVTKVAPEFLVSESYCLCFLSLPPVWLYLQGCTVVPANF